MNKDKSVSRFVITSTIQGMSLNENALKGLETYCGENNAELKISEIKYNPYKIEDYLIDTPEAVLPYLLNDNWGVEDLFKVYAGIKVSPTAKKPLNGFSGFGGNEYVIIPSPRIQYIHQPTGVTDTVKVLATTGTISNPEYPNNKTASIAEFHHTYGAVLVEVLHDTKRVIVRQLPIEDNGIVIDMGEIYTPTGDNVRTEVKALVLGDLHCIHMKDSMKTALRELVSVLHPRETVLHDVLDSHSVSHHHIGDNFTNFHLAKHKVNIEDELTQSFWILDYIKGDSDTQLVLIDSNHNSHFTKWLNRANWQSNMSQATNILKWQLQMLTAIEKLPLSSKIPDLYGILAKAEFNDSMVVVHEDDSHNVEGFELGFHGHAGLNGSRSLNTISTRTATKLVTAHTHSPQRMDGHLTVGTSSPLKLHYTSGLSTWGHANVAIYEGGKAQLIPMLPNDFRVYTEDLTPTEGVYSIEEEINRLIQNQCSGKKKPSIICYTQQDGFVSFSGYRNIKKFYGISETASQNIMSGKIDEYQHIKVDWRASDDK